MKIATAAILTLASATLTSASRPSLRGIELSMANEESSVWDIARSFKIDSDSPSYIRSGKKIFDVGANEVTLIPRSDHSTVSRSYESATEGSKQTSFNLGVSGGFMGFSAAASASTKSMNRSKKKFVRIDYNIDTSSSIVQLESVNPHKHLLPEVKEFLLERTPEEILNTIGPYYATRFTLGSTFELRVVGEVSGEEESNEFKGHFSAAYGSLINVTIGGSNERKSNSTCTKYTTSYVTAGGDSTIWQSRSKDANTMLDEWQKSLTPENMRPIQHKLQYIWDLLDNDDMNREKAAEVESYILAKWEDDANRVAEEENDLVPATWGKENKITGNIVIRQPSEESGKYKVRFDTQSACNYIQGYDNDGNGKWGLDQLYCSDNSNCLKWQRNSYVGRMTLPKGVKATTYWDWELNQVLQVYEAFEDMEVPEFWTRTHRDRAKGFKFEPMDGYTCGEAAKCL